MADTTWVPPEDSEIVGAKSGWTPPQDVQTYDTNPITAFGKSALESAPQAVGGTLLGIPGAVAGASILAPTGPVGSALGAIGGGLLFGATGAKSVGDISNTLLNKFMSEKTRADLGYSTEQRESERQQFPVASQLGEYAPDILTMAAPTKALEKGVLKFAANNLWAKASPAQKEAWKVADDWGLTLQPRQIREDSKAMVVGREKNTRIMNSKVAEATGDTNPVQYVDQKYLNTRFDDLGNQYSSIYNDPNLGSIPLDQTAQDALTNLMVSKVPMPEMLKSKIVESLKLNQQVGGMSGSDFKVIMSELKKVQRTTNDGNVKYSIGDTIDSINNSIATSHPEFKAKLDELNPKYRALLTAQDARNKDIIDSNGNVNAFELGKMLRDQQGNPLYQVGQIGESLGIGSHGKGDKFKNAQDARDVYLYGITPMMNIAKKAANMASGEGVGLGAKYLQNIKGGMPSVGLADVFRKGGPALETSYSQLNRRNQEQ